MDQPMETSGKTGLRRWIVLSAWIVGLGLVGAGVAWQLLRILPGWIEDSADKILLDRGIVLTGFPVESIGWNQSQIGKGGLVYESHSLEWEGIWIDYHFKDLLKGNLVTVLVERPVISIELPGLSAIAEKQVAGVDYLTPELVHINPDESVEDLEEDTSVSSGPEPEPTGVPVVEISQEDTGIPEAASLWEVLQDLNFGGLRMHDGVVNFSLLEEKLLEFSMQSEMVKEPFGVSAELVLLDEYMSSNFSLRAPAANPIVTVQGHLAIPGGGLEAYWQMLSPLAESLGSLPALSSSGNLTLDLFAELDDRNQPRGSAEFELDELVMLAPGAELEFSINDFLAAGYYKDGLFKIESGAEVLLPEGPDYRADSFGLRLSLDSTTGLEFETETFGWNYAGTGGKAAIRGSGSLSGEQGRIELALSEVAGEWIVLEPFSVLMEARPDGLFARTSEIGARKTDTIWIEDFALEANKDLNSGKAGFTWYDAIGLHMGDVNCDFVRGGEDLQVSFSLMEAGKPSFLSGKYTLQGETAHMNAEGKLLFAWVNSLGSWWGGIPAKFGGKDPAVQLDLRGLHPFYSGTARIEIEDSWIELDGETRMEGIHGSIDLSIIGLPMVVDTQELTISRITSGQFELENVQLDWAMPTIRQFELKRLEAKIGGGTVSVDPFTIDPMNPVLQSQIHINQLEGNQLLDWLGESRFSVEGSVSGRLVIGWRNGEIILGDGILELDSSEHEGRFVFEDPSFLQEQFNSFGGIQKDLKERFLSALLEEGIDIHSMEISLGAAPEEGKILLRMAVSGETKNELLEVPIKGFIINNVISGEDLGHLMGLIGPVRIRTDASGRN